VDAIDFSVRPGRILGLLGPNGSGKSTTLKIILGLLHPTSGSVRAFGRSPRCVPVKRHIGYLPEESYLYPHLSPRETLGFYARLFNLAAPVRKRRVEELLEMVGLSHAAHRHVGEFSKGMARRVGLAQALINDPRLVILDEPTSGLDPIGCRQVKDLMLALARRGKTIILSSHLLADVEDVCDEIIILYSGTVRARGTVKTLLEKSDRQTIGIPALPPAQMEELLAAIRARIGCEPDVSHPSLNLEQFFLSVVEEANRATTDGSGVRQAKGLASYLSGE